jgi:hypothetical protein
METAEPCGCIQVFLFFPDRNYRAAGSAIRCGKSDCKYDDSKLREIVLRLAPRLRRVNLAVEEPAQPGIPTPESFWDSRSAPASPAGVL